MLKAQLKLHCSSSWSAGLLRACSGSQTEERIPQRVSGLSHDSMCGRPWSPLCWDVSGVVLVWSLFFSFLFFWTCTSVLLLFVTLVCLSVNFELLLRLLFLQCWISPQNTSPHFSLLTPSLSFSLPHTHTHTPTHSTTHKPSPHTPWLPLFALPSVYCFSCWLTFLFSCSHGKPVSKQRALTVKQTA